MLAENFSRRNLTSQRHGPSACAPVRGGVAAPAAVLACVHKFLAAWLALHVFVNASHIKSVMTLILSAEPWEYDSVVHEREQTCHNTGIGHELGSTGAKAVSFLPSRPTANLICGVEQLPKSAPEVSELVLLLVDGVFPRALFESTGCPLSSRGVTALKLVFAPKNLLNTAGKLNCMKLQ